MSGMLVRICLIFFLVDFTRGGTETETHWGYSQFGIGHAAEPDQWYKTHESCNGTRQSPVNIDCTHIYSDPSLKPLVFENYNKTIDGLILENDGHTVKITVPPAAGLRLRSESLDSTYRLSQFHFHWGYTSITGGSEHTINGERWPLEMHLVHTADSIAPGSTSTDKDSIVVVSVLFENTGFLETVGAMFHISFLNGNNNPKEAIEVVTEAVTNVTKQGDKITLSAFNVASLLPQASEGNYLRYSGSLTTPPCSEVVEWIILTGTKRVNPVHLSRFRSINGADLPKVVDNRRPLQTLNERPIRLAGTLGTSIPSCRNTIPIYASSK